MSVSYEVKGKGHALLLLHGALVSRAMWAPQLGPFSQRYRVIACDLPAHGASPDLEGDYTIAGVSDRVALLLDSLEVEQAHLCGHSLGGMVAQHLAVTHPRRVGKLVLAETAFGTSNSLWEGLQSAMARPFLRLIPQATLVGLSARRYGALNAEVGRFIEEEMSLYDHATSLRVLSASFGFAGKRRLERVEAPTLVLVAEGNPQTHAQAREMKRRLPRARLEVIPDAHHLLNLDNPAAFNDTVLGFLQA